MRRLPLPTHRTAAARQARALAARLPLIVAGVLACAPSEDGSRDAAGAGTEASALRQVTEARFRTVSGEWASLAEYRGRVAIVNLWGTWCAPCRRELPELVDVERAYRDRGLVVIGIAVDSGEPAEIVEFAERYGVRYPIWISDMATALAEFQAVGYPFTLLVGRDGTIRHQFYGPQSLESIAPRIEPLLDRP